MKTKVTQPSLPENHVGIIYIHERTATNGLDEGMIVAKLRGLTGKVEESKILRDLGFWCTGKSKGDLVFKQRLSYEALKRLDLACAKIEGLVFVAPDGLNYRLLSLPLAAGKTKAGYVIYRKGQYSLTEVEA